MIWNYDDDDDDNMMWNEWMNAKGTFKWTLNVKNNTNSLRKIMSWKLFLVNHIHLTHDWDKLTSFNMTFVDTN